MKSLCGCIIRSLQRVHNLGVQIAAWNIIFACLKEPLHMSPVNHAGSVVEISPQHSFLGKKFDAFI